MGVFGRFKPVFSVVFFLLDVATDLILVIPTTYSTWNNLVVSSSFTNVLVVVGWSCLTYAAMYGVVIYSKALNPMPRCMPNRELLPVALILSFVETALEILGTSLLVSNETQLELPQYLSLGATLCLYVYTLVSERDVLQLMWKNNFRAATAAVSCSPVVCGTLLAISRFADSVVLDIAILVATLLAAVLAVYSMTSSFEKLVEKSIADWKWTDFFTSDIPWLGSLFGGDDGAKKRKKKSNKAKRARVAKSRESVGGGGFAGLFGGGGDDASEGKAKRASVAKSRESVGGGGFAGLFGGGGDDASVGKDKKSNRVEKGSGRDARESFSGGGFAGLFGGNNTSGDATANKDKKNNDVEKGSVQKSRERGESSSGFASLFGGGGGGDGGRDGGDGGSVGTKAKNDRSMSFLRA